MVDVSAPLISSFKSTLLVVLYISNKLEISSSSSSFLTLDDSTTLLISALMSSIFLALLYIALISFKAFSFLAKTILANIKGLNWASSSLSFSFSATPSLLNKLLDNFATNKRIFSSSKVSLSTKIFNSLSNKLIISHTFNDSSFLYSFRVAICSLLLISPALANSDCSCKNCNLDTTS